MSGIVFQKYFKNSPNGPFIEFTSCCGASQKGTEYGVVCRACYGYIDGYSENAIGFRNELEEHLRPQFDEMLTWFDKFDTWNDWHDWYIKRLVGA